MYTRCPYCYTYFKVHADHLKKAHGKVRCGQCFKIFNSLGNLIEELPIPLSEKNSTRTSPPRQPVNKTALDRAKSNINSAATSNKKEKAKKTAALAKTFSRQRNEFTPHDHSGSLVLSASDKIPGMQNGNYSGARDLIIHPTLGTKTPPEAAQENLVNTVIWGIGLFLLIGLFFIQYTYFYRDDLARHDALRPLIENLCKIAKCEIPLRQNIALIQLTHSDVTSHPNAKNALIINAVIVNNADYRQPYPVMKITLSNTSGLMVASRNFAPIEYLDADINIRKGMPPHQPIQIVLEIADPGKNAVNFQFDFSFPKTN